MLKEAAFLAWYLSFIVLSVMSIAYIIGTRSPKMQTKLSLFYLIPKKSHQAQQL
jgi:hypothetical protein